MGRSYSQIYFHIVFTTKYREPLITHGLEKKLFAFMKGKIEEHNCTSIIINGMPDHVHILFRGRREIPISKIVKSVKGASSRWINENQLTEEHFSWQEGYGAFSVSDYHLQIVFQYIKNQKTHHREDSLIPTLEVNPPSSVRDLNPSLKKGA